MIVFSGRQLTLTRKLALLAIDPENGRLRGANGFGLAAASLLDLTLKGRVAVIGRAVRVTDERPTGDAVLDEALCRLIDEPRERDAADWVRTLGRRRELREHIVRGLEEDGLIRRLDARIVAVFPAERYVVIPPRLRAYLVARLRATLLAPGGEATPQDQALAVLLASVGMLDRFFARDERDLAAIRAGSLLRADHARSTVAGAVSEVGVLASAAAVATGAARAAGAF